MSSTREGRRLARGLSALMSDAGLQSAGDIDGGDATRRMMREVPLDLIDANPNQPRKTFATNELEELAASIRAKGVLQPLIVRVRVSAPERYEIVAGERRWRAAQAAGLRTVPVMVRDFDDIEVIEVAIVENVQRSDLNPLEEAMAYRALIEMHGHTQEQLGTALGRSRSHIANILRLTNLPPEVQAMVRDGVLSAGHARALLVAERPIDLARDVVGRRLSVRDTERLAKRKSVGPDRDAAVGGSRPSEPKDADTRMIEGDLSAALRMRVTITHGAAGDGGQLTVRYRDLKQLDALCELLSHGIERE